MPITRQPDRSQAWEEAAKDTEGRLHLRRLERGQALVPRLKVSLFEGIV